MVTPVIPRPRRPRLHAPRDAVTEYYEQIGSSVSFLSKVTLTPENVVVGIGVGRLVLSGAMLAAPGLSLRILGTDTATAKRVTHLARMTAVRDIGLGAGTLAAGPTRAAVPWLLAGAAADAVDAAVVAGALRRGRVRGVAALGLVIGAAGAAAVAARAALQLRDR